MSSFLSKMFLTLQGSFEAFSNVMGEYFQLDPVEPGLTSDLNMKCFIFLCTRREAQPQKLGIVFDVSAKSLSGVSLNNTLLVGPTVNS